MSVKDQLTAKKAALYIRVSTQMQADKDSLKVQERELIAYCEMILGITDHVAFIDPGFSAKDTERPAYQEMMRRIRAAEFSHLLCWKIDRISRNIVDFAMMSNELKQLGVTFVSKNEQFDTSTAMGEAMLQIIMVFAEFERKQTSERVSAVMISRAEEGQWNGGRVPYGYSHDKTAGTFSVIPEEADRIKRMADLYEEHQSLLQVTRIINSDGWKTRSGAEWSTTGIHKILTNPWYIGNYVFNVHIGIKGPKRSESEWTIAENHHDSILGEDQFYRIKYILSKGRRSQLYTGKSYKRTYTHIFAGLMRCGICGGNMGASIDRKRANGFRPSQYACYHRRAKCSECTNKYISDLTVAPFVLNYISNIIRASKTSTSTTAQDVLQRKLLRGDAFAQVESINPEAMQKLATSFSETKDIEEFRPQYVFTSKCGDGKDVEALRAQRRKLGTALSRLNSLYLYADDAMPEKEFVVVRGKIEQQLATVNKKLSNLDATGLAGSIESDDFLKKASYYILVNELTKDDYVNYEKFCKTISPDVIKDFLNRIIRTIEATDGRITAITFKNGIEHRFTYKA